MVLFSEVDLRFFFDNVCPVLNDTKPWPFKVSFNGPKSRSESEIEALMVFLHYYYSHTMCVRKKVFHLLFPECHEIFVFILDFWSVSTKFP